VSVRKIVALLGRRDEPTDGVADYCEWLGRVLPQCSYELETFRIRWPELGWRAARSELCKQAAAWRGCWVLLQYTPLAWSRRGFPIHAPNTVASLRGKGLHVGVVFHDFRPFDGTRMIDRFRHQYQLHVLWRLYQVADCAIFTAPPEKIPWLPRAHDKAVFIPAGANCPEPTGAFQRAGKIRTVAVFCVTGGWRMTKEVSDIGYVLKRARDVAGPLRLVVFGRGSQEADPAIRAEFAATDIDVQTLGLLSPEEVSRTLAGSDVLLFVRGEISSRRSSAIAGIACGLPIVAYQGPETGWPVTEAGLIPVPDGNREALSLALTQVLSDGALQTSLADRSRRAHQRYFSWLAIAACYSGALERLRCGPQEFRLGTDGGYSNCVTEERKHSDN
jgi:glycosyltransferase involved in cell wall biosynthesis